MAAHHSLHEAVRLNDIATARCILQSNPSCVNEWNLKCQTALHLVYKDVYTPEQADDRLPTIQLLLDYGADVNAQTGYGETPLFTAVLSDQAKGVKLLLENGADPNICIHGNTTTLHQAMSLLAANDEVVRLLLKYGAKPNAPCCDGQTPLDYIICDGIFKLMPILMEARAKANNIYLSLTEAAVHDRTDMIKLVLDHADDIYLRGSFSIKSLLHFVSSSDHLYFMESWWDCGDKLTKQLSKLGVDVGAVVEEGRTALHVATREKNMKRARALLEAGVDVNVQTLYGDTPLHLLLGQERRGVTKGIGDTTKMIELLLRYGADPSASNHFGHTPFQMALTIRDVRIINMMLSKITRIAITNDKTKTWVIQNNKLCEFSVAASLGYEKVVDRLIDMKFYLRSNQNALQNMRSPLFYAIIAREVNVVKMLLDADFRIDNAAMFNLNKYDDTVLRIVCLLSEYHDFPIIKLMFGGFNIPYITLAQNKLIHLFILYYARDVHINKISKEFICMRGIFKSNELLSSVLASCNDKLNELKKDLVSDSLSKFDIISMKLDLLVKILNNKDKMNVCQNLLSSLKTKPELQYDEHVIKTRIDLAIEKRNLLVSAKDCLSLAFQEVLCFTKFKSLPDELLWKIIGYLNVRELQKLKI